jgi:hypothetical protein
MHYAYNYTWKHNFTISSARELGFDQPLKEKMAFASLKTGATYRVVSIGKAKENDRDNDQMPEDVVQTFSGRQLTEETLSALREQCKWEENHREFLILTSE